MVFWFDNKGNVITAIIVFKMIRCDHPLESGAKLFSAQNGVFRTSNHKVLQNVIDQGGQWRGEVEIHRQAGTAFRL